MRKQSRILLATCGSLGDILPFLAVARRLRQLGYHAELSTWPRYRTIVESEQVPFVEMSYDYRLFSADNARRAYQTSFGTLDLLHRWILPWLNRNYQEFIEEMASGCDLLLAHPFAFAAQIAAEKLGVPWFAVHLQPGTLSNPHALPTLPSMVRTGDFLARQDQALAFEKVKRGTLSLFEPLQQFRISMGLARSPQHPLFETLSPSGNLGWFSRILAPTQADEPKVALTGFTEYKEPDILDPGQNGLKAFVSEPGTTIVFALGSSGHFDQQDFVTASIGISKQLGVRAVILTGIQGMPAQHDSEIYVAGYVSHQLVFPRAAAIVLTGGIGTIAAAMRASCPMLCVPFSHDQTDNAYRVRHLGIADVISRRFYNPSNATPLLDHLLRDNVVRRTAEWIGLQINSEDGVTETCRIIGEFTSRSSAASAPTNAARPIN